MLPENTGPRRNKSALERRIDMGLDTPTEQMPDPDIDVEQFIADDELDEGRDGESDSNSGDE